MEDYSLSQIVDIKSTTTPYTFFSICYSVLDITQRRMGDKGQNSIPELPQLF